MVDSSRHFLPLAVIRRTLDSLPYAKLNVLHWHVSDTQSFPFQSKSRPLYAKNGRFEPFIYTNAIILPRQARDKHRENSKKAAVSQVG